MELINTIAKLLAIADSTQITNILNNFYQPYSKDCLCAVIFHLRLAHTCRVQRLCTSKKLHIFFTCFKCGDNFPYGISQKCKLKIFTIMEKGKNNIVTSFHCENFRLADCRLQPSFLTVLLRSSRFLRLAVYSLFWDIQTVEIFSQGFLLCVSTFTNTSSHESYIRRNIQGRCFSRTSRLPPRNNFFLI